jgi:hypothetical protein
VHRATDPEPVIIGAKSREGNVFWHPVHFFIPKIVRRLIDLEGTLPPAAFPGYSSLMPSVSIVLPKRLIPASQVARGVATLIRKQQQPLNLLIDLIPLVAEVQHVVYFALKVGVHNSWGGDRRGVLGPHLPRHVRVYFW